MSQWMKSQHLKQKMHNMTQSRNLEALSRKHQLKVTRSTRFKNSSHSCTVYNTISSQILAYWSVLYELCQIMRQRKNILAQNVAWMLKPWCNFLEVFLCLQWFPRNLLLNGHWRGSWIVSGAKGTSGLTTAVAALLLIPQPSSEIRSQSATWRSKQALWSAEEKTNGLPPSPRRLTGVHQVISDCDQL